MGKYGYKFIGTDGIAMSFCEEHDKSLSDKSTQTSSQTREETGDLQCPTTVVSTPEKVSSTENELADCLSKLVIAVAKIIKSHNDRE